MKRKSIVAATIALGLLTQLVAASGARAQGAEPVVGVAGAITSVLATVIALPVKAVTCVSTVALGGVGYGLAAGSSEFVREELLGGLPYACGGRYYIAPQEVREASEPAAAEWAW